MIYAVFDTNVLLQAILSEGGPADECVQLTFSEDVTLVTSDAVLDELKDVISRPSLIAKYEELRTERPQFLIQKIYSKAIIVSSAPREFILERDRSDEIFVNLALKMHAEFLVSRDKDLLDLMKDSEFCSRFPDLQIVDPVDFLRAFRAE